MKQTTWDWPEDMNVGENIAVKHPNPKRTAPMPKTSDKQRSMFDSVSAGSKRSAVDPAHDGYQAERKKVKTLDSTPRPTFSAPARSSGMTSLSQRKPEDPGRSSAFRIAASSSSKARSRPPSTRPSVIPPKPKATNISSRPDQPFTISDSDSESGKAGNTANLPLTIEDSDSKDAPISRKPAATTAPKPQKSAMDVKREEYERKLAQRLASERLRREAVMKKERGREDGDVGFPYSLGISPYSIGLKEEDCKLSMSSPTPLSQSRNVENGAGNEIAGGKMAKVVDVEDLDAKEAVGTLVRQSDGRVMPQQTERPKALDGAPNSVAGETRDQKPMLSQAQTDVPQTSKTALQQAMGGYIHRESGLRPDEKPSHKLIASPASSLARPVPAPKSINSPQVSSDRQREARLEEAKKVWEAKQVRARAENENTKKMQAEAERTKRAADDDRKRWLEAEARRRMEFRVEAERARKADAEREAEMREAEMREAEMREAEMIEAEMREAEIREGAMREAEFREAEMREAERRRDQEAWQVEKKRREEAAARREDERMAEEQKMAREWREAHNARLAERKRQDDEARRSAMQKRAEQDRLVAEKMEQDEMQRRQIVEAADLRRQREQEAEAVRTAERSFQQKAQKAVRVAEEKEAHVRASSAAEARKAEDARQAERACQAAGVEETKQRQQAADLRHQAELKRQADVRRQIQERREAEARKAEALTQEKKRRQALLVQEAEKKLRAEAEQKAEKTRQEAAFNRRRIEEAASNGAARNPAVAATTRQTEAEQAREKRIRALAERNARNRQVPDEEEDSYAISANDGLTLAAESARVRIQALKESNARDQQNGADEATTAQSLPRGPVSLNSLAGVERLRTAKEEARPSTASEVQNGSASRTRLALPKFSSGVPSPSKPRTRPDTPGTGSTTAPRTQVVPKAGKNAVGEILPEDIKLVFWREAGNEWEDIVEDWEEVTGYRRSEDTLRRRCRMVKNAIGIPSVDVAVLRLVMSGDVDARRQLNAAVHGIPEDAIRLAGETIKVTQSTTAINDQVGEVTPDDIKLMVWRDNGNEWQDIIEDYEAATGTNKSEHVLRKRYRILKEAVGGVDTDAALLSKVSSGDISAREDLNRRIHGTWPIKPRTEHDASDPGFLAQLGEITLRDIQLVEWKASSSMPWNEVPAAYEAKFGQRCGRDMLMRRFRLVKAALDHVDADDGLLARVLADETGAKEALNTMVHGTYPVPTRKDPRPPGPVQNKAGVASQLPSTAISGAAKRGYTVQNEIIPEDIMLVRWRDDRMKWTEIVVLFEQATGIKRDCSALCTRYKKIKAAISVPGVDNRLLDRVADGDFEARKELNLLIYGTWPVSETKTGRPLANSSAVTTPAVQQHGFQQTTQANAPQPHFRSTAEEDSGYGSFNRSSRSLEIQSRPASPVYDVRWPQARPSRPTTGGKQLTEEAMSHYFDAILSEKARQEEEKEEEEDEKDEEDESLDDFTEEDFVHFIYYTQRREILTSDSPPASSRTSDDSDSDSESSSHQSHWLTTTSPTSSLSRANAAAASQASKPHHPTLATAHLMECPMSVVRKFDKHGCLHMTVTIPQGKIETRVQRQLRSFRERVPPASTVGWVGRGVYAVKQRCTTETTTNKTITATNATPGETHRPQEEALEDTEDFDPVFSSPPPPPTPTNPKSPLTHTTTATATAKNTKTTTTDVGATCYTTLESANSAAIAYFVAQTFRSQSVNLDVRDLEKAELIKELGERFLVASGDVREKRNGDGDGDGNKDEEEEEEEEEEEGEGEKMFSASASFDDTEDDELDGMNGQPQSHEDAAGGNTEVARNGENGGKGGGGGGGGGGLEVWVEKLTLRGPRNF
ncbi:hypothetical protein B0A50_03247 [Salinomyces thailandicus]|uniref:Uncharacterized protein n=1 Tax=Salinomyces thailandicus TaxID=706561 RepID=A0A4U0U469_9PEZI|nr:hypothetical protein B0A50_03247 [Salinomyces thailandica]